LKIVPCAIFHVMIVLIVLLIVASHAFPQISDHFLWIINVNVCLVSMRKILRIVENVITVVQNARDYLNFNANHVQLLTIGINLHRTMNACANRTTMMMV
jgi:hypothetical protein